MYIKQIKLLNFRNYSKETIKLQKKINLFIGANGQGKTNILEAIYFSITGKSFRETEKNSIIKKGKETFLVSLDIEKQESNFKIETKLNPKTQRNEVYINNKKTLFVKSFKEFPVFIFCPKSLSYVQDSSSKRREFIDIISLMNGHSKIILNFKKNLAYKTQTLKNFLKKEGNITTKKRNFKNS